MKKNERGELDWISRAMSIAVVAIIVLNCAQPVAFASSDQEDLVSIEQTDDGLFKLIEDNKQLHSDSNILDGERISDSVYQIENQYYMRGTDNNLIPAYMKRIQLCNEQDMEMLSANSLGKEVVEDLFELHNEAIQNEWKDANVTIYSTKPIDISGDADANLEDIGYDIGYMGFGYREVEVSVDRSGME